MLVNTTLQAAVHLGQDNDQNSRFVKNHLNQTDIIGVSMIDHGDNTWSATSLLCDRIHHFSTAELRLRRLGALYGRYQRKPERGLERKWYFENNHLKDLKRIDGESMEFEWKIFPRFTTLGLLKQSQEFMKVWELWCAGFRHSACFHARVILDGAACRLGELGDVHDVLGVLGVDSACSSVVVEGRVNEEDDVLVVNGW